MATRPELHIAVAKTKSKASEYNENFTMMMGYIEDSMEEFMPSVTGNSGKVLTTNGTTTSWTNAPSALLQAIYPVGSIYIGTMAACPLASLFGTWEKVAAGRVLQGADNNHAAGTTIAAGLPDHKHRLAGNQEEGGSHITSYPDKAIKYTGVAGGTDYKMVLTAYTNGDEPTLGLVGSASKTNSIYGASSTVQPPAYVVNIWERTA